MKRSLTTALLFLAAGIVFGQEFWQPEVRKAIPVEQSSPTPEPPTAPAVPFEGIHSTPRPVPRPATPAPPVSGSEPAFTPYRPPDRAGTTPVPPAQSVPTPDENGDIRLSPANAIGEAAAAADLDRANSIYARKMYDYAAAEYEKFLIVHPKAKGRDMALFRLAESHRLLGNDDPARAAYEKLVMEFRDGEFAGSGAYRLGEYLYAEKKYDAALSQFQVAAAQAGNDEVRLSARYNIARCYDRLKRSGEAAKMYAEVVSVEKNNPYREYARLSLAENAAAAGRKTEALETFGKIASGSGPTAVRAEASVKAAALAAELGDKKKAVKLFAEALNLSGSGEWKSVAFLGAMRLHYELGEYKKVATLAEKPPDGLPDETRAEMLLLAANSYRQDGNARAARAVYDRLLLQFPGSAPSQDARFHRLVSMYQLNDPDLIAETEKFLKESTNPKEHAQVNLLKAESFFKAGKYAEAGPIYAKLLGSELAEDLKIKALYKLGWCQAQSGDSAGAIQTYTEYIRKNPQSPNLASALTQRGLALQQTKDYPAALQDFDLLIEKYQGPARELALQQKALILGQQQDYKGMITVFRQLLTDFPKSSAAGQANFWIGWAAFEEKDYPAALTSLEAARKLDPAQYGERSALRIILCYYYQQDRPGLLRTMAENKNLNIPVEITRWLGRKSFDEGDYASAEKYLLPVVNDAKNNEPEVLIELAEAQIRQGKGKEAASAAAKYLETARDPRSRARGLIAQASIELAGKNFDQATKLCEEALLLQPEGRLNAEGRFLMGEINYSKGDFDGAARAFMTIAVLYDDASLTPRALRRAADAYKKSGNTLESQKALHELQQRYPDFQKAAKISKEN